MADKIFPPIIRSIEATKQHSYSMNLSQTGGEFYS